MGGSAMLVNLLPRANARGSLKSHMERRRLVAKWFIQQGFMGWQDVGESSVAGLAKVSGCLYRAICWATLAKPLSKLLSMAA